MSGTLQPAGPLGTTAPHPGMEPAPGERVVVAMSGGVDSSVAAALLVERGFEVVGISLRLAEERPGGKSSGCCSIEDFQDAARVAAGLGIAHYVFDMRREFARDVVAPFVGEYLAGRTPSPCILCNRSIKFSALRQRAAELGAAWVATGHYARRDHDGTRADLDAVAVGVGARGTGQHDAGAIVARKHERPFDGAGGQNDRLGAHLP